MEAKRFTSAMYEAFFDALKKTLETEFPGILVRSWFDILASKDKVGWSMDADFHGTIDADKVELFIRAYTTGYQFVVERHEALS